MCASTRTVPNRTLPRKVRTEPEPKCHGSYSVLSLNEKVGTFTFDRKGGILLFLGETSLNNSLMIIKTTLSSFN